MRGHLSIFISKYGRSFNYKSIVCAYSHRCFYSFVLLLPVNRPDHYLLASLYKEELLQNTSSPKIIIIGGSNTVFNVDCREISRAIGLPVVNMGLHAGLGLHFMLNEVEPYLQAGDIVLIIPEYDQFFNGMFDGSRITLRLVTLNPSTLRYIRTGRQLLALPKGVGLETRSKLVYLPGQSADENTYSRHVLDEFGDLKEGVIDSVSRIDLQAEDYVIKAVEAFDPVCIRDLNRFHASRKRSVPGFISPFHLFLRKNISITPGTLRTYAIISMKILRSRFC